jgi:hypothetical protein
MAGDLVEMPAPQAGAMVRQDFAGTELSVGAETASTAIAAQARAAVEARYIMALRRPRDWDDVRVKLLKECTRPGFAAVARYSKPRGGKAIEGPSIRFAEAALRAMGNAMPEVAAIYDDAQKRIVRVTVTDLEANLPYSVDVVIDKTVERARLRDGEEPLSVRLNSSGKRTYLVPANDDDLLNKQNALVSKALRTAALRLLPGDILEECMERVLATVNTRNAADPDAERKKIADGFARLNISPAQLREYLGHDLGGCSPAELGHLRGLWQGINEGAVTWADAMEHVRGKAEDDAKPADDRKGNTGLRNRLKPEVAKQDDVPMDEAARERAKETT